MMALQCCAVQYHPILSKPIASYPIPSHPNPSHPIPPNLIWTHPIPSHLIWTHPIPSRRIQEFVHIFQQEDEGSKNPRILTYFPAGRGRIDWSDGQFFMAMEWWWLFFSSDGMAMVLKISHHHHWWFLVGSTIGNNGFSMVFSNFGDQWFSMVTNWNLRQKVRAIKNEDRNAS